MKVLFYCLLAILWPGGEVCAQTEETEFKPLSVGDSLPPDLRLESISNYPRKEVQISTLDKELTILNIWATTCATCLHSFPELDSLQELFDDRIQIFLVNPKFSRDDTSRINKAMSRIERKFAKRIRLPIVVEDTSVYNLFRFQSVPYYIWIDRTGVIRGITKSKSVSEDAIQRFLETGTVK